MSPWQKLVVFITSLFRSVPKLEKTQISFKQIMEKDIVLLSGRELPVSSVQCTLHWGRISTGTSYPAWRKPDKKTPCYINSGTVKGIKTGVACRRFWVELECPLSWFDHIHLTVYAFVKTNEMYALDLCASKFYLKKEHHNSRKGSGQKLWDHLWLSQSVNSSTDSLTSTHTVYLTTQHYVIRKSPFAWPLQQDPTWCSNFHSCPQKAIHLESE